MDPEVLLANDAFVRALAFACLQNRADAEDVAQEAWMRAISSKEKVRSPRGWFATFVKNAARDLLKTKGARARRERAAARPEGLPSMEEVWAREAARREVVEAVARLAEPYKTAVLLRYFEELTVHEAAARLNVPVETARTRLKRALLQIRDDLDRRRGAGPAAILLVSVARPAAAPILTKTSWLAWISIMSANAKIGIVSVALILLALLAWWKTAGGPAIPEMQQKAEADRGAVSIQNDQTTNPEMAAGARERVQSSPSTAQQNTNKPKGPVAEGLLTIQTKWADDQTPAPNIWVAVETAKSKKPPIDTAFTLRSNGAGVCETLSLPAGDYVITTARYTDPTQYFTISGGAENVTILVNRGYNVTGRVVDARGDGVADAEIWCFGGEIGPAIAAGSAPANIHDRSLSFSLQGVLLGRSAADGSFTFEQISYHQYLTAYKTGFAAPPADSRSVGILHLADYIKEHPGSRPSVPPRGKAYGEVNLTITLRDEERTIRGRVVDDYTKPIAGAIVRAVQGGPSGTAKQAHMLAIAGADGVFTIRGIRAGNYSLQVRPPIGGPPMDAGDIFPAPAVAAADTKNNNIDDLEIRLPRGAVVEGTVTNPEGRLVGLAHVVAAPLNDPDLFLMILAETDDFGNYKLVGVPPGAVRLSSWGSGDGANHDVNLDPMQHFRWDAVWKK